MHDEDYKLLVDQIIKHQESIIGPIALVEASKVNGIKTQGREITIEGDGKIVLQHLVEQYQTLFGQASVEACKDALRPLLPKMKGVDLPQILL